MLSLIHILGGRMGGENAKVRVGIYIEKAILEQADGLLETANVRCV